MNSNILHPTPGHGMTADDVVIRTLALSEAEWLDRLAACESDRRVFRELAQAALHQLARLTRERDHARASVVTLREELRRFTARTVTPERAA